MPLIACPKHKRLKTEFALALEGNLHLGAPLRAELMAMREKCLAENPTLDAQAALKSKRPLPGVWGLFDRMDRSTANRDLGGELMEQIVGSLMRLDRLAALKKEHGKCECGIGAPQKGGMPPRT